MHVTRLEQAPGYFPAEHHDMVARPRGGSTAWLSQILPDGDRSLDASPIETIQFLVEGALTMETPDGGSIRPFDSCRVATNEAGALTNKTNKPVIVLLAIPHAAAQPDPMPA
jgi:hypothetical protein